MKFSLLTIILITFCNVNAQNEGFSLKGKTSNIDDGTYLYLRNLVNGGNIDSAKVDNNSFTFTTDIPEPTIFAMLFTKDRKNFKEMWLEDRPMTFDASKNDFNNAIVTGSKNQELSKRVKNEIHLDIIETSPDTIRMREVSFVKEHPNSLVSPYILYGNRRMNQTQMRQLFSILSEEVKQSSLGQKIAVSLEKEIFEIGNRFADFSIPDTENEIRKLSEFTGKLTLLQFWSSSCSGSRKMNLTLNDLYKKYHSQGFNIISISKDEVKENWINAIEEDHLSWPQLSNLEGWKGEVFQAYGISSTPSNLLINENGVIIEKNIMGPDLEGEILNYFE
jgi:peroxiredoxin